MILIGNFESMVHLMAENYMKTKVHSPRLCHLFLQLFNAGADLYPYEVKLGLILI